MAISEHLCWEVFGKIQGKTASIGNSTGFENTISTYELERDLVLRFSKQEIEDSLYFLEKRGYLLRHGFLGYPRMAYQLSDAAINVINENRFSDDEQEAFKESLFEVNKPGWLGMKFNISEALRRIAKKLE